MAKLMLSSSYGCSPIGSFLNDWIADHPIDDLYSGDNSIISPDPEELFEDLNLSNWPSIHSDIQKIESDNAATILGGCSSDAYISAAHNTAHASDDADCAEDVKPEIRNIDCMWSSSIDSQLKQLSTSASSSLSDGSVGGSTAVPLSVVTGSTQNIINNNNNNNSSNIAKRPPPPTVVIANNSKLMLLQQQQHIAVDIKVKMEPNSDDYEQQLQQHSIPNSRTGPQNPPQTMHHIPPGTSLLRKSNPTAQQQQQQQQLRKLQQQQKLVAGSSAASASIQIPKLYTAEFLRDRDLLLGNSNNNSSSVTTTTATIATTQSYTSATYVRPDTPHSLDDDATSTEFKHNVDLRACVMGSNNISLTADPSHFIQHVSQELQDTSKNQIDMRFISAGCSSLAEVLDVIVKDNVFGGYSSLATPSSSSISGGSNTTSTSLRSTSDSDDSEDEESMADSSCADLSLLEDADCMSSYASAISPVSSKSSHHHHHNNSSSSSSHSHHHQQPYLHSDHSYTRCKDGMDDLGPNLETPSDSDEEIDVVSIGDKKLPTNPSDKDRRAIQTKVANKFSNARIVKTANGVRTIPPRRRVSYELPYTPASSSPVKSVVNSRYPSPASTPYQSHNAASTTPTNTSTSPKYMQQQQMLAMLGDSSQAPHKVLSDKNRKRVIAGANIINGIEYSLPPSKKHRGKKTKQHGGSSNSIHNTTVAAAAAAAITAAAVPSATATSPVAGAISRQYSLDEAADTIEKRNLHNDMERQRRIGLKNLFEALKKQIPSIKDKERAPKVNILREAAKLCEALTREDAQLCEQKALLKEQLRKRQELLARLRRD